jgi:hypothetical protein
VIAKRHRSSAGRLVLRAKPDHSLAIGTARERTFCRVSALVVPQIVILQSAGLKAVFAP